MSEHSEEDQFWMQRALGLATHAARLGEVPVGAVVVLDGREIGAGAFGAVYRAKFRATPVAVKKLHRHRIDEANLTAFRAECELHPAAKDDAPAKETAS